MNERAVPIFDGHNDTLLKLEMADRAGRSISFLDGDDSLHIDLPKALAGSLAGGLFAIFTPPEQESDKPLDFQTMLQPLKRGYALDMTLSMMARAFRLEQNSKERVRVCRSSAEISEALQDGVLALMLHIEGAEAIDRELEALDVLYAAGLRSLGPVWSRSNIFGFGVPFAFPGSPDCGPGLTDAGRDLVKRCDELGILVDLSHLNEKGFWDVCSLSDKPLVATHSNVHALCPSPRNLTDRQLDAIAESDGLVGLNYSVGFLSPDGEKKNTDIALEVMVDHLIYLVERLGEGRVGLGSDFDGTTIPDRIGSCAGNQMLLKAMREKGFGEALIEKIAFRNWLDLLKRSGI